MKETINEQIIQICSPDKSIFQTMCYPLKSIDYLYFLLLYDMSLIYLAKRPSRSNKITSEWYHFWPHFAYVFTAETENSRRQ